MKKCTKCQTEKPANRRHFAKRKSGKFRGVCRDCNNARIRKQYKDDVGGSTKREQRASTRESDPKICIKCKQLKPLSDFNWHNREKGQHRNFCKDCQNVWAKKHNQTPGAKDVRGKWNEDNIEKIKEYHELYRNDPEKRAKSKVYHRRYWLKKYGLTLEEYDDILNSQDGKCMICKTEDPGSKQKNFAVDHCHKTGKVRGLLCFSCNVSIGHFKDNVDFLHKAINYLDSFNH